MKAAPVIAALRARDIPQRVIHTGQHYDDRMSDIFFRELRIQPPDVNLGVGSGSHAVQTAALMVALETELLAHRPALVVVYGDINSTLAAAVVAAKIGLPLAHVEAGLRSFDDTMPEEINRRVTDELSTILFTTSPEARDNLHRVGIGDDRIAFVGNPMIDTLFGNLDRFDPSRLDLGFPVPAPVAVATIHRPANVDDPVQAARIVRMLDAVGQQLPVIIPLHPRGRATLAAAGLDDAAGVRVVDPLGYLDFITLVRGAAVVVTDSGGIQEETTMLDVPCLTVRPNTERPITISHGTNRLLEPEAVPVAVADLLAGRTQLPTERPPRWDGQAGPRIAAVIDGWLRDGRVVEP